MIRKNSILFLCLALMLVGTTACEKPQDGGAPNVIDLSTLTSDIILEDRMVLTGTLDGEKQHVKISIADGATVILNEACIKGANDPTCKWARLVCLGDATIIISGKNSLSGYSNTSSCIFVPEGKTLKFKATNTPESFYDERGERLKNEWDKECADTLNISNKGYSAAIGGTCFDPCGNIEIWGGVYYLSSGWGPCIGSGPQSTCGDIRIEGGHIFADAGKNISAAIGSGDTGQCGDIIIRGGRISARAGYAAAIGSGKSGFFKTITIERSFEYIKVVTCADSDSIPIGRGEEDSLSGKVYVAGAVNPDRYWNGTGLGWGVSFSPNVDEGTWEILGAGARAEW